MATKTTSSVKRMLRVTGLNGPEDAQRITHSLLALPGMQDVRCESATGAVRVRYELPTTRIHDVELALAKTDCPVTLDFLGRLKLRWLRFTEQNQVDTLRHTPHCCAKPPTRHS